MGLAMRPTKTGGVGFVNRTYWEGELKCGTTLSAVPLPNPNGGQRTIFPDEWLSSYL